MRQLRVITLGVLLSACATNSAPPSVENHGLGLHRAQVTAQPGWAPMGYAQGSMQYWVEPQAQLNERHLQSVEALVDETGQAVVLLTFDEEGRGTLEQMTRDAQNQPLAILIDGQLRLAPLIQAPISDGRIVISGFASTDEALRLVTALKP